MSKLPLLLILISIPLTIRGGCRKQTPPSAAALFIFGDSIFDPGNNNYINTSTLDQANFRPYGDSYFSHPTGRFSDGRLISDFIAEHAKLPLIPPYLQPRNYYIQNYHGVNFASAGAGALSQTFEGLVIDLKTQLKYFSREIGELRHKIGDGEAAKISSNAVYMFSIGTNDYMSPFLLNSSSTLFASYPPSKYVDMVLGNLSIIVKEIHRRGGRKFVFLNLGMLGCLPGLRILDGNGGCLEEASNLAKLHNTALTNILEKMEQQLHDFNYFLYDYETNLAQMMSQPLKYGLEEGKAACCGTGLLNAVFSCGGMRIVKEYQVCQNPSRFLFWDSYHLTERANKLMADQMWTHTLKKLFLC